MQPKARPRHREIANAVLKPHSKAGAAAAHAAGLLGPVLIDPCLGELTACTSAHNSTTVPLKCTLVVPAAAAAPCRPPSPPARRRRAAQPTAPLPAEPMPATTATSGRPDGPCGQGPPPFCLRCGLRRMRGGGAAMRGMCMGRLPNRICPTTQPTGSPPPPPSRQRTRQQLHIRRRQLGLLIALPLKRSALLVTRQQPRRRLQRQQQARVGGGGRGHAQVCRQRAQHAQHAVR